ncbi:rare lipoprotein A [Granulicella rosea]|uniref:Probable endolytic peptidoglycan transglycosylase RlpA n=1 Tax=Granulicella rosea TaxID=474952 RepID=A0A239M3M5_9BACT|nr:septal ring lytic transglycosylase RlpA family protein [Granulicella rosea]SNT37220.1 rare lipoprotein A [Granulicella rosea]
MLRFLKIDLIVACLAVASLWVVALPPLPPPPSSSPSAFAASVQTEFATQHHPLRAIQKFSSNLGLASWYGSVLDGHPTASGEIFDKDQLTACHRTLPFGTMVRVVDVTSGKSVVVKINDRGVLSPDRVIDLSSGAARELGILRAGIAKVRLEVLKNNWRQAKTEPQENATPVPLSEPAQDHPY